MKLACDCGNTDPDRFSVVEERIVFLSVDHDNGVFLQPGGRVKEEATTSTKLYCDKCNVEQEIE